jgi:hypothetical protein
MSKPNGRRVSVAAAPRNWFGVQPGSNAGSIFASAASVALPTSSRCPGLPRAYDAPPIISSAAVDMPYALPMHHGPTGASQAALVPLGPRSEQSPTVANGPSGFISKESGRGESPLRVSVSCCLIGTYEFRKLAISPTISPTQ